MIDNTRVNDLQDKLLQAMDIINAQALKGISFDKTIVCTIQDNSQKSNGQYTVTDGSRIFIAYSADNNLKNNDQVYVTIPEGNFENQKMIIGKKTDNTDKPFNFVTPFDTIFDMTSNVVDKEVKDGSLIANALNKYGNNNYEYINLCNISCNYYGYSRLGLKANFKSWIKEAIKGDYGLAIILAVQTPNIASSQKLDSKEYYYTFSNNDMYGNTYSFETDYEQQIVIPLDEIKGTITNIKINFYQEANFFNQYNMPINCSLEGYKINQETNTYELDEDGDYQLTENATMVQPNLFVKDIYLCFGYELSRFTKDFVEIYTQQSYSYKASIDVKNDGVLQNKKNIKVRWVHIDNNSPKDMTTDAFNLKQNEKAPYEVRWYRYQIGAAAADSYCGVYWTRIVGAEGFSYDFEPDINAQTEKIKIIIIYENGAIYPSNELVFENEEKLPPSEEAQKIANALTIIPDDASNGNYMVYGQDNSIKDTAYGKEIRTLSAYFNIDEQAESFEDFRVTDLKNLTWYFPQNNTMLELLNSNTYSPAIVKINYDKEIFFIQEKIEEEIIYTNNHVYDSNATYYIKTVEEGQEKYTKVDQNSIYVPSKFYIKDYVQCTDRSIYNSNQNYYTITTIPHYEIYKLTEDKFNQSKSIFWSAKQCNDDSIFDLNLIYCIQNNNIFIEKKELTEKEFNANKNNYWNMSICTNESVFDENIQYYTEMKQNDNRVFVNSFYYEFINTEDKSLYWFFTQCNKETSFSGNIDYYLKQNKEIIKITEEFLQREFKNQFNNTKDKEKYWIFNKCDEASEYNKEQIYCVNIKGMLKNAAIEQFKNEFNTLEDKTKYFFITQCDENSIYDQEQIYFIRQGKNIEKISPLTEEEFNINKTQFWFMTICENNTVFDEKKEYYIINNDTYIEASNYLLQQNFDINKLNYWYGIQCNNETEYVENQLYYIILEDGQFAEAVQHYFEQGFGTETAENYWIANQCNINSEFDNNQDYYIITNKITEYIPVNNLTLYEFLNDKTKYWYLDYTICKDSFLDEKKEYYVASVGNGGIVENNIPQYKISSYYSPEKSNNTVTCKYVLNGRTYITEKEFTFGPAGTMGTDQTIVIDFIGDTNAVNVDYTTAYPTIGFQIQLYDQQNKNHDLLSKDMVEWAWYYNSDLAKQEVKFPYTIEGETKKFLYLSTESFDINGLYILQATVGKLTTYFPVPVQSGGYSRINGPTQVIYYSTGEPAYSRNEYKLYQGSLDNEIVQNIKWEILSSEPSEFYNFIGKLEKEDYVEGVYYTKNDDNTYKMSDEYTQDLDYYQLISNPYCGKVKYQFNQNGGGYFLSPLSIYVQDAPIYGVQAKTINDQVLWTQPILVLQNKWPNGVINAWDGESLVLDEKNSTILAASIAAGKKNSDNSFSGVMLGDWKGKDVEGAITKQTGVYGFHEGAVSYALKEDGTAFFGKDGKGRIYINGNDATIYSPNYNRDNNSQGMMIDLNDASINMTYAGKNIKIDAGATGNVSFSNMSKAPFTIGSKFAVAWDGTIYATGGNFKGTISASTLKGTDRDGDEAIYLEGYFNIPTTTNTITNEPYYGYFGSLAAELPASSGLSDNEKAGIGMSAGEHLGVVKATRVNVGMSFGDGYITINHQPQSDSSYTFQDYIHIDGGGLVCAIEAENQHGIYARFAE